LKSIAQRYLEVVMAPDAVALWRLIVAEGPRFPHSPRTSTASATNALLRASPRLCAPGARESASARLDADHVARQFLAVVRSDLHILALSGLLPDDLETAIHKNVQEAVKTFWPALRRKDDEQS